MAKPSRIVGIARVTQVVSCESCHLPARFVFTYTYSSRGGELLLCDKHLRDLLCDDASLLVDLVAKLHDYLEPLGCPLLLP